MSTQTQQFVAGALAALTGRQQGEHMDAGRRAAKAPGAPAGSARPAGAAGAEPADSAPALQSRRTLFDQLSQAWRTSPSTLWIGTVLVAAYQYVMWTGPLGARSELHTWPWLAANAVVVLTLVARRRLPVAAVVAVGAAATAAEVAAGTTPFAIPLMVTVYALITTAPAARIAVGLCVAAACFTLPPLLSPSPAYPLANRVMASGGTTIIIAAAAFASRSRRMTLERRDAQLLSQATERRLAAQRDDARRQARIAAELHDSVGHSLTAIIALSEGLKKATGDPDLDEAISTLNALARDGLADTRRAVAAIAPSDVEPDDTRPRGWDAVAGLLATVRSTGLTVTFTETGRRPDDEALGVLVHTVAREAMTNVMRHAAGASRVVVSLDHGPSASELTVSDDGAPGTAAGPGGHGLDGMAAAVERAGGTFSAGPGPSGWVVRATLPHCPSRRG